MLYTKSGLLGVSGISNDMRALRSKAASDPNARRAIDLFVYRITREIGSLIAALGGIDGLVFTAGIGENSAPMREKIATRCAWLGLVLDPERNATHGPRITGPASRIPAFVIPTDEEQMIARHTLATLQATKGQPG